MKKKAELWTRDVSEWSDSELIGDLKKRYDQLPIPPCRICGGELSIAAIGGGRPTKYACSGSGDDGKYLPGRSCADEHYRDSHYEDYQHADNAVIEAVRRWTLAGGGS